MRKPTRLSTPNPGESTHLPEGLSSQEIKGRSITVFVSHSWGSENQYWEVEKLLDSISDLSWTNVSVVQESPLKTETVGEPAQQQEIALQSARIDLLRREYGDVWSTMRELEDKVEAHEHKAEAHNRFCKEVRDAEESMFSYYMVHQLEDKYKKPFAELKMTAESPSPIPDLADHHSKLIKLRKQLHRLKAWEKSCRERIVQLRRDSGLGVRLVHYPSQDILYSGEKISESVINEDHNLALMLEQRVARSDIVVVIGEAYPRYRSWMECELIFARSLNRPIVVILPPGLSFCPSELKSKADEIVLWDRIALGKALLRLHARS